jgi:hypothetical protein
VDWPTWLEEGETLTWSGRPAPRCYTFRRWRRSVFGILLLLLTVYWQIVGFNISAVYGSSFFRWVPFPFLLAALYMSVGHLFLSRLEWEKAFYAITDRRVLVMQGLFQPRVQSWLWEDIDTWCYIPQGGDLGSIRIIVATSRQPVFLHCHAHPRKPIALMEEGVPRITIQGSAP